MLSDQFIHENAPKGAERRVRDWLWGLPDDHWVFCELRVNASFRGRVNELSEKRPDFVVVGPRIGLVSIETKDWNIDRNQYEWIDQRRVRKLPEDVLLDNPWHQAFVYLHALKELVESRVWVTSLVSFPLLGRAHFGNQFGDPKKFAEPQARTLLDIERTIFSDDVDAAPGGIVSLLEKLVRKDSRFREPSPAQVQMVCQRLIPSKFRVGEASERRIRERGELKILTKKQQDWALRLSPDQSCLLDLAGSGKTNVLVSRAIHLADLASRQNRQTRILLLTYNRKLARAMEVMLQDKMQGDSLPAGVTIDVNDVEALLEHVVAACWGHDYVELFPTSLSRDERNRQLREQFAEIATNPPDTVRIYDSILIDEIQDFDAIMADLVRTVSRGEQPFMVGDLAQRIHQRRLELSRFHIDEDRSRLPAEFAMYRCPPAIARMAHGFAFDDPLLGDELKSHGYSRNAQFRGKSTTLPECRRSHSKDETIDTLVSTARREIDVGVSPRDVMVVTSPERVERTMQALRETGTLAKDVPGTDDAVLVVDFVDSKGLEAEVVIISGVEDLPVEAQAGPFATHDDSREVASLSRRKVYVALTRTTGRLIWIYHDSAHRLVADLLRHSERVTKEGIP